jgi:hypothetical protein
MTHGLAFSTAVAKVGARAWPAGSRLWEGFAYNVTLLWNYTCGGEGVFALRIRQPLPNFVFWGSTDWPPRGATICSARMSPPLLALCCL